MTTANRRVDVVGRPDEAVSSRVADSTYWTIRDIQFHCRIGRSTAWRLVRRHDFPPPVVFGARAVMWPRAEVIDFMELHRRPDHYRGDTDDRSHGEPKETFVSRPVGRRT